MTGLRNAKERKDKGNLGQVTEELFLNAMKENPPELQRSELRKGGLFRDLYDPCPHSDGSEGRYGINLNARKSMCLM